MTITKLFPTLVYYSPLKKNASTLNRDLVEECYKIRSFDRAGQSWSKTNYPGGFTSFSSMDKLYKFSSTFQRLSQFIDPHVRKFAQALDIDTKKYKLSITDCWINIVPQYTYHGLHLHPNATISGTYYVQIPKGDSGVIKFEDPRMAAHMATPPRRTPTRRDNRRHVSVQPRTGHVLLFESWLRHEVTQNQIDADRLSISFNYHWC